MREEDQTTEVQTVEDELRPQIEKEVAQERKAAQARLDELRRRDKVTVKLAEKASAKFNRLAGKNHDKPLSKAAEAAMRSMVSLVGSVEAVGLAIATQKSRVEQLAGEGIVEARLNDAVRRARTATPNQKEKRMATPRKKREVKPVPKALQDRIIKAIESGRGGPTLAREFQDAKIENPYGGAWRADHVRRIYAKAKGVETWAEVREKFPLAAKVAASDSAPRAARRVTKPKTAAAKKTGSAKRGSAKPLTKAEQAAGTSRGGSGSRTKTSSMASGSRRGAAKRGTTKRSTTKSAASKRAPVKRGTTAKRATAKRATTKRSAAKRKR